MPVSKTFPLLYLFLIICLTHVSSCKEKQVKQEVACQTPKQTINKAEAEITTLSQKDYPNDPDNALKSRISGAFMHGSIQVIKETDSLFTLKILPGNEASDTLYLDSIVLSEFIPTIPQWVKDDEYLSLIGIINQEWNRQQVRFQAPYYRITGSGTEKLHLARIDIARNCLNAYLWEVILYTNENNETKPYFHGWFSFPNGMYKQLFKERNGIDFCVYEDHLVDWKDPESHKIDLSKLRTVLDTNALSYANLNDQLYPLVGERKKKEKNIVFPKQAAVINDFLTDSTKYATFSPPGFYDYNDPRTTYLSRLAKPADARLYSAVSANNTDTITEIQLTFEKPDSLRSPLTLVCGFQPEKIPVIDSENSYKGYQMPMGISNHTFYATYKEMLDNPSKKSPFYALLIDAEGNFVDSHKVGIDGPLFYFDKLTKKLHLYIISFERHSFVGHYSFDLKKNELLP